MWPDWPLSCGQSIDQKPSGPSTSVFVCKSGSAPPSNLPASPQPNPTLYADQRQDALEHARQVDVKDGLPWKIPWREVGIVLGLIAIVAGLSLRDQPYFLAAMQKQTLMKQIQAQAAELEELQSNIQKLENLTAEQRYALEEPVDEAARRLESAQSLEEALSALNQAEQDLQALSPQGVKEQAAGLRQTGQALGSQAGNALESFGENLARGEYDQAAQALEAIDPSMLSATQQRDLAENLQSAAETLSASNPELSQGLQNAAEALQSGDPAASGQSLDRAAQTLRSQAGDLAMAEAAGQAASQLNASQQNLAQAGASAQAQTGGNPAQSSGAAK